MNEYMKRLLDTWGVNLSLSPEEAERRFWETLRPDQRDLPEEMLDAKRRLFVSRLSREQRDGKTDQGGAETKQ